VVASPAWSDAQNVVGVAYSPVERRKNVSTWRGINVSGLVWLVSAVTRGSAGFSSGCVGRWVVVRWRWWQALVGVESVVAVFLGCMGVGLWVVVA
jgi:hypothetical protein